MEEYDKRMGWRGPILNKKITEEWNINLKKYKLEKTIGWDLAIVKKIKSKCKISIPKEKGKSQSEELIDFVVNEDFEDLIKFVGREM